MRRKETKIPDPASPPKGELNFAYISMGVLLVFIFLAVMNCTGQRNETLVPPISNIGAH
jgi:hypothetical protein